MAKTINAHADRNGVIVFTQNSDEPGLVRIGSGGSKFRKSVEAMARHGYDGSLLVPGIPEAASDEDAMACLSFFREWVSGGNANELAKRYDISGIQERALERAFRK